eukprot:TRINITY_DN2350_c0_g1::TRINITY_DN2350_c0_g1_i1::g.20848::m.20848 TRINITY_DN2350_c0_g1::TRINITY_DN2350_c0_g1_i1::g.20848  ORF type:complete len:250 (-),score=11.29,sp/Q5UP22/YR261_MIMIV/30.50/7e-19 TRINITY_DN2350_c0_g1_i1:232-981(-)
MVRVSIIGSAGGHCSPDQLKYMNSALFSKMKEAALRVMQSAIAPEEDVHLLSGGAAWSDHVAVQIFLDNHAASLTLHLPTKWVQGSSSSATHTPSPSFSDNGSHDWRVNPGRMSNQYHRKFSDAIRRNSLLEIHRAIEKGAKHIDSYKGFHARNDAVAKNCDLLIAFSWSIESKPADGGTSYTWNKCPLPKEKKFHISLYDLITPISQKSAIVTTKTKTRSQDIRSFLPQKTIAKTHIDQKRPATDPPP